MIRAIHYALVASTLFISMQANAQNTFPNSGNVGIGTKTPSYPLTIETGGTAKLISVLERADINAYLQLGIRIPEVFVAKGRDGITDIWGIVPSAKLRQLQILPR